MNNVHSKLMIDDKTAIPPEHLSILTAGSSSAPPPAPLAKGPLPAPESHMEVSNVPEEVTYSESHPIPPLRKPRRVLDRMTQLLAEMGHRSTIAAGPFSEITSEDDNEFVVERLLNRDSTEDVATEEPSTEQAKEDEVQDMPKQEQTPAVEEHVKPKTERENSGVWRRIARRFRK